MRHRGFTLIEVLIAAAILFMVLSLATVSFKTARESSAKAAAEMQLLSPLPFVMDTIRTQIRLNPQASLEGDGAYDGVTYRWTAMTEKYKAPIAFFDPESMSESRFQPRFRLYQVELVLQTGRRERTVTYKELAWDSKSRIAN